MSSLLIAKPQVKELDHHGEQPGVPHQKLRGSSSEPEEHGGKLGTGKNRFEGLAVDVCSGCTAAWQLHCCNCRSGLIPSIKSPMHVNSNLRAQSKHPLHQ